MTKRPTLSLRKVSSSTHSYTTPITSLSSKGMKCGLGQIKEQENKSKTEKTKEGERKLAEHNDALQKERKKRIKAAKKFIDSLSLPVPLAIGGGKELLKILVDNGGYSKTISRKAINQWVKSKYYLLSIVEGQDRYHLDGSISEPIEEKHKHYATKQLKKIYNI